MTGVNDLVERLEALACFMELTCQGELQDFSVKSGEAELIREASRLLRQREGWQPIESAPKDGTSILGYFADRTGLKYSIIFWVDYGDHGDWFYLGTTHHPGKPDPTHWMPFSALPAPPTETERD